MNQYKDIIHLSRPVSARKPMARENRAAQFAPFAALTGYDAAIEETARLTESRVSLSEDQKAEINRTLCLIREMFPSRVEVNVVYFVNDLFKAGGKYCQKTGEVKKIDDIYHEIILTDGEVIPIREILDVTILSM